MEKTLVQQIQEYLYSLIRKNVLSINGKVIVDKNGNPEEFISKGEVVDGFINLLNEFGEELSKDKEFNFDAPEEELDETNKK